MTDLMMPGLSGLELAQTFISHHPVGNVLYMSGHTDDIVARHALMEEGGRFIQKPFSPAQLARTVRDVLDGAPR
jgi:FixJ family two-component response regulator